VCHRDEEESNALLTKFILPFPDQEKSVSLVYDVICIITLAFVLTLRCYTK
jgi:hypothetical protein